MLAMPSVEIIISTFRKLTKIASKARNFLSQAANIVDVLSQLPKEKTSIQADKINQFMVVHVK